jgi:hypothetical protein
MGSSQDNENVYAVVGMVVILGLLLAVGYAIHAAAGFFSKPSQTALVSLSAYFVDELGNPVYASDGRSYANAHIHISGEVDRAGEPVSAGRVLITAEVRAEEFSQSVSVPLVNGQFFTESPAFRSIRPGDKAAITANVTASGLSQTAKIQLNTQSPVTQTGVEIAMAITLLALTLVFFYAFTGPQTQGKNRVAIVFSYVVIGLFLAVPILAPVMLLRYFPEAVDAMIGQPAGLINTHTANQDTAGDTQWALNIGGYSYIPADNGTAATTPNGAGAQPNAAAASAGAGGAPANAGGGAAKASAAANPPTPGAPGAGPGAGSGKTGNAPAATPKVQAAAPAPAAPAPAAAAPAAGTPPAAAAQAPAPVGGAPVSGQRSPTVGVATAAPTENVFVPPRVNVEGGLIIPLYVIILSVIGGAINMTRKVPQFQREGEAVFDPKAIAKRVYKSTSIIGANLVLSFAQKRGVSTPEASLSADTPEPPPSADAPAPEKGTPASSKPSEDDGPLGSIDAQLDQLLSAQLERNCESDTDIATIRSLVEKARTIYATKSDDDTYKINSFDAWYASHPGLREVLGGNWRVELLNQYMYLISAPFLAIVSYYILDLLAVTKEGVIVVISFSVGLISEKIVSWILNIATGYMTTPSGKPAKTG